MKLIIAGGRDYAPKRKHYRRIVSTLYDRDVQHVVSGGADGADFFGELIASRHDFAVSYFLADWNKHGKAAGAIRNEEMAQYADGVILLPGGRGTNNMFEQAEKYGLEIFDWRDWK